MAFRFSLFITFWQSVCVSTFLHYSLLQYPYHINLSDCRNFTMSYLNSTPCSSLIVHPVAPYFVLIPQLHVYLIKLFFFVTFFVGTAI
jgi:hypothetical protein